MAKQSSQGDLSPNLIGNNIRYTAIVEAKKIIPNEVKTIQILVSSLTKVAKQTKNNSGTARGEINPSYKINERFKEYSDQLNPLYIDLSIRYGEHYQYAIDEVQLGTVEIEDIGQLLRQISVGILENHNNNPLLALDALCKYFEDLFFESREEKFEYNHGALRYCIYKQLIECNVFPNPIKQ